MISLRSFHPILSHPIQSYPIHPTPSHPILPPTSRNTLTTSSALFTCSDLLSCSLSHFYDLFTTSRRTKPYLLRHHYRILVFTAFPPTLFKLHIIMSTSCSGRRYICLVVSSSNCLREYLVLCHIANLRIANNLQNVVSVTASKHQDKRPGMFSVSLWCRLSPREN